MTHDIIVLGAGMVGVGCALHLQAKGQAVALVDRRAPGLETSYGNAGIIQREAIGPYALPRDLGFLLSGMANQRVDVRYQASDAARMLGPLWAYHRNSAPAAYRQIARAYETLIALSLETHAQLMNDANANHLVAGQDPFDQQFQLAAQRDGRRQRVVHHHQLVGVPGPCGCALPLPAGQRRPGHALDRAVLEVHLADHGVQGHVLDRIAHGLAVERVARGLEQDVPRRVEDGRDRDGGEESESEKALGAYG